MKLVIQIPCYDEEESIGRTLDELPGHLDGIDTIEVLIIDDGSSDRTAEGARRHGAHHVVSLKNHQGLATAFRTGLKSALELGADLIVNTDADNQYRASDLPALIEPILEGRADITIGARPVQEIAEFSHLKKWLQRFGSRVVRWVSGTSVADAPCGYRAFSAEAARAINVFTNYTYTLETIIQAGLKNMAVESVPIRTNKSIRPSRLMRNSADYVKRSTLTIIRVFMIYSPMRFFAWPGIVLFVIGGIIGFRFLFLFLADEGQGHVQSLILAAILIVVGTVLCIFSLIAELIAVNRRLLEEIQTRLRSLEDLPRGPDKS
jgi:glycosyltransferase involved in cell wall biosynthesis